MKIIKRIKINDSSPSVGIFEVIDNHLYYLDEPIDYNKAVNGVVDAGDLFHIDLVKYAFNNYHNDMTEETLNLIKDNLHNSNLHRYFPRGRVCYDINEDKYYIYSCMEVLKNHNLVMTICRNFNLPYNKTELVYDSFHYDILKP